MAAAQALHMSHRLTDRLSHHLSVGTSIVKCVSPVVKRMRVRSGLGLRNFFSMSTVCPYYNNCPSRELLSSHVPSSDSLSLDFFLPVFGLQIKPRSQEATYNNIRTGPGESKTRLVYVDIFTLGTKQSVA